MRKNRVQEIIAQLRRELQQAENIDADAQRKVQELERHVDEVDEADPPDTESLWDRAKELETRFAAGHPTLERIARDLADAIAKMGV